MTAPALVALALTAASYDDAIDSARWRDVAACRDTSPDLFFPVGTTGPAIEQIAQAAEISKSAAERAVDALVGAVKSSLRKDEMVTLVGFGTFYAGKRAARTGRNPRTGEALEIKAARLPKFRAGKALKDAIN